MDEWDACPKLYPSNCTSGQLTKDPCGCCDECAKAVGQSCGGMWGFGGNCADGLTCYKPAVAGDWYAWDEKYGICCSKREIEKTSGDAYVLDNSTDQVDLNICLDVCVYRKERDLNSNVFCFKDGNLQANSV